MTLFSGQIFDVIQLDTPDGPRQLVTKSSAVAVFAVTTDNQVVLTNQYRVGTGNYETELPAGLIDENEDALIAAQRELAEETGYTAPDANWVDLGLSFSSSGFTDEAVHHFLVTGVERTQEQDLDMDENITIHFMPLNDIAGKIDTAFTSLSTKYGILKALNNL